MHETTRTSDPEPHLVDTAVGPIALTREGDPGQRTVICLHGIPGSHRDFRYLAPLLAGTFHVVRVDAPGFARSPRGAPSVDGLADALWAVADALDVRRGVLLGHSFGGAAVLHAADRHPERTEGIVLLASPGGRLHRGFGMPHWVYSTLASLAQVPLLRAWVTDLARRAYRQRGLPPPDRGDWRTVAHQLRIVSTLRFTRLTQIAAALQCPSLLAHCADDPLVEVEIARELAATLRDCHPLFFASGGHHLQKHRSVEIAAAMHELFGRRT